MTEIGGIKDQTRADFLDGTWQWLLVWSAVCVGAAASAFTPFAEWYWMVGAPIGLAVTVLVSMRAEARVRLRRKPWPYMAVSAAIGLANGALSYAVPPEALVVGLWVVLGLGFAALTSLDRVPGAPSVFIALACFAIVAGLATPDTFGLYPILGMMFACVLGGFAFLTWRAVPE